MGIYDGLRASQHKRLSYSHDKQNCICTIAVFQVIILHVGNNKIKSFRYTCTLKTSRAVKHVIVRPMHGVIFVELSISPLCSSVESFIIKSNYSNEHLEATSMLVVIYSVGETEELGVKWTNHFSGTPQQIN